MKNKNEKVLIAEDDKDFLSILEKVFTANGFFVVTAENGEDGLAKAESENPDLIISDVLMPRMGGLDMAKNIREKKIMAPILFLTNVEQDAPSIENSEYLMKTDLHIDQIIAKVKEKLGIK